MNKGLSSNNSYSLKQIRALGDNMKISGWMKRLIGKEVSSEMVNKFLNLTDNHLKRGEREQKYICNCCGSEDITVLK